jgi:hypothetical protein
MAIMTIEYSKDKEFFLERLQKDLRLKDKDIADVKLSKKGYLW